MTARLAAAVVDGATFWVIAAILVTELGGVTVSGVPVIGYATLAAIFAYQALSTASPWAASPGKRLLGLKIARADGAPLTVGRAAGRAAAHLLCVLPAGVGLLVALVHPRRRGLHDLIAGTIVVAR